MTDKRFALLRELLAGDANLRQVGGSHYRDTNPDLQHWDLMAINNVGYFPAQVTKYLARWRKKGGINDLEKSQHYLQKMIEVTNNGVMSLPQPREIFMLEEFINAQGLHLSEMRIFRLVLGYTNVGELQEASELIDNLK